MKVKGRGENEERKEGRERKIGRRQESTIEGGREDGER